MFTFGPEAVSFRTVYDRLSDCLNTMHPFSDALCQIHQHSGASECFVPFFFCTHRHLLKSSCIQTEFLKVDRSKQRGEFGVRSFSLLKDANCEMSYLDIHQELIFSFCCDSVRTINGSGMTPKYIYCMKTNKDMSWTMGIRTIVQSLIPYPFPTGFSIDCFGRLLRFWSSAGPDYDHTKWNRSSLLWEGLE